MHLDPNEHVCNRKRAHNMLQIFGKGTSRVLCPSEYVFSVRRGVSNGLCGYILVASSRSMDRVRLC